MTSGGKDLAPVTSSTGLVITPTMTYADCPNLDVLCVPGGAGVGALMEDVDTLDFLKAQSLTARYVTSVCTGSLVLGAAGLLRGRKATTHWAYHDMLAPLGAIPVQERVVRDGNLFTGGGITAGIDFALVLAAELYSEAAAQLVQLQIEYAPAPPFDAGRPDTAPQQVLDEARKRTAESRRVRGEITARAAARLG
ncbi:DJ-1/PfpI family protein [Pseudomonas poae]